VTLRRTLLLAFVLLGLLPSTALSWLSFSRTREAMSQQIAQSLDVQAQALQSDIDKMLFERFENALVWSRSELMQDLRLGDVDKRVSTYLAGLNSGYGDVYQRLDCRSADGTVLASTHAGDIGKRLDGSKASAVSVRAELAGGQAQLSLPETAVLDERWPLVIETAIHSVYAPQGEALARLHLELDARQFSRLLDRAALGQRQIIVIDAQGRWVAGSKGLRGRAMPDAPTLQAGLRLAAEHSANAATAQPWMDAAAIVGRGHSRAMPGFAGAGWTTLVMEPVDAALAPVDDIARIFVGLLGAVLLATLVAASLIGAAIARPILALTAKTQRYQREGLLPEPEVTHSRITELSELGRAYIDMISTVDHSRQELVRSSKLAMLGELGAVLAHEVRTPLGILRSSAQVLLRDPGLSADSRELMGFIESETERLNRLVSTMLDTARPRRLSIASCDMHALLQRCAQMRELQGQHAACITLDLAAHEPLIEADAEQLMQAVFNLLNNAIQAVGPQGRVALYTADEGEALRFECRDDGPGIPPELAGRIFDPFVTGRDGGIGLGLAVVRQVIVAHGGRIRVGRSDWGGTVFTCWLPRHQPMAEIQESSP